MIANINTERYWNTRFTSGDWSARGGRRQTRWFALAQVRRMPLPRDFTGTIVDFGCGLGDAIPVYRRCFPRAELVGVDISAGAIASCRAKYGSVAKFRQGDHAAAPECDVVIASNVLEHLDGHEQVATALLRKCRDLFVAVPYREHLIHRRGEHVNTYDEHSFADLPRCSARIFACRGWSQCGWDHWYQIRFKNALRMLLGRPRRRRDLQILFHFHRP